MVLIANEPAGQVVHYLLGPFGENSFGPEHQMSMVPAIANRVIIFTEYPDLAGRGWYARSDKVSFLHKWEDVIRVLKSDYPGSPSVAVFPNAEIQYTK